MNKRVGMLFLAGLAAVAAAACYIPIYIPGGGQPYEFHQALSLDPGGTVSLDNVMGDIEIRGWDRDEVDISAAYGWGPVYGRRYWPYGQGFGGPRIRVDRDKDENAVKIVSPGAEREESPGQVRPINFYLSVPRSVHFKEIRNGEGNVRVSDVYGSLTLVLERGKAEIENFSGTLDVSLRKGSVAAELLDERKDDSVRISVRDGDITLSLQPDISARLDAEAEGGRITSEFDLGPVPSSGKISAHLGQPEGISISLGALRGRIRLKKSK